MRFHVTTRYLIISINGNKYLQLATDTNGSLYYITKYTNSSSISARCNGKVYASVAQRATNISIEVYSLV